MRTRHGLVLLLLLAFSFACSVVLFSQSVSPAEQYLQLAADRERAALNLPPLRWDLALVAAARKHAQEMANHNAISHQFAHEPDLAARGAEAGARFSTISENVAQSPNVLRIHEAWMNSEGHRHNLLDPNVDSIGIAVLARGRQLFAVEDFGRDVQELTVEEQESAVSSVLAAKGIPVGSLGGDFARNVCNDAKPGASIRPAFVMHYTTANLERIPEQLLAQMATGRYRKAAVAACDAPRENGFSMYSLAVLLYTGRSY